jgi:hypothetical protein
MKKVIFAVMLPLIVVSGLVFANRETKNESTKKKFQKPLSSSEKTAAMKKWEATPDGIKFNCLPEVKKCMLLKKKFGSTLPITAIWKL